MLAGLIALPAWGSARYGISHKAKALHTCLPTHAHCLAHVLSSGVASPDSGNSRPASPPTVFWSGIRPATGFPPVAVRWLSGDWIIVHGLSGGRAEVLIYRRYLTGLIVGQ